MNDLLSETTSLHKQLLIELQESNYNRAIYYARKLSSLYENIAKNIYENHVRNNRCDISEHDEDLPIKYNSDYDRD